MVSGEGRGAQKCILGTAARKVCVVAPVVVISLPHADHSVNKHSLHKVSVLISAQNPIPPPATP